MLLNIFCVIGLMFCGYIYIMFTAEEFLKRIQKPPYRRKWADSISDRISIVNLYCHCRPDTSFDIFTSSWNSIYFNEFSAFLYFKSNNFGNRFLFNNKVRKFNGNDFIYRIERNLNNGRRIKKRFR